MNDLKAFALIFCISSIISAIAVYIVPEGAFKKIFTHIISLLLIIIIVRSVSGGDLSIKTDIDDDEYDSASQQEEYSQLLNEYIFDSGKQITEDKIRQILDPLMTGDYRIDVNFIASSDGVYCPADITIYIFPIDTLKQVVIQKRVGELTGIIPEVIINE